MEKSKDGNYLAVIYGKEMKLSRYFAVGVINEFELWEEDYTRTIDLNGKNVLDVGSGNGETALIFLHAGASKVVGIESDPEACKLAIKNAQINKMNFEVRNERFTLDHLKIEHDFLKIDIEGGEAILMDCNGRIDPFVIETHGIELTKKIAEKFRTETVRQSHEDTWILKKIASQ